MVKRSANSKKKIKELGSKTQIKSEPFDWSKSSDLI